MLTFCSVFSVLKHYDAQTPGGIILRFALAASFAQGVLSHAVPHFMNTSAGTSSSGERQPLLLIGLKSSWPCHALSFPNFRDGNYSSMVDSQS